MVPLSPTLRAIVFDFDGLVIETEWCEYVSIDGVFRAHGTHLDEDLWRSFIGTTDHPHWTEILEQQLGRNLDCERLRTERVAANRPLVEALPIKAGVEELMVEARARGVLVGIASSSPRHEWVESHLRRLDLWQFVDGSATGDEVRRTKPDPAVYLLVLERLGVTAETAVAIEDSPAGCQAALAAGMASVAVPSTMTAGRDFPAADVMADSVAELNVALLGDLVASRRARL